ncbi:MAG: hypothetical protein AB7U35_02110 [Sphingobium sp.]
MTSVSQLRTAIAMMILLAPVACVPPAGPPPPAPPPPAPVAPAPAPAPPLPSDWRDWPVAAGDWSYRAIEDGSIASFGQPGQAPLLTVRCMIATRTVAFSRLLPVAALPAGGQITVHTSFGDMQWPIAVSGGPDATATATRAANDTGLDRISFSRGRFALEAPGAVPIAVPNWAEISRVIEDCRE